MNLAGVAECGYRAWVAICTITPRSATGSRWFRLASARSLGPLAAVIPAGIPPLNPVGRATSDLSPADGDALAARAARYPRPATEPREKRAHLHTDQKAFRRYQLGGQLIAAHSARSSSFVGRPFTGNCGTASRWPTLAQPWAPDLGIGSAVPGDQGRSPGHRRGARGRRSGDLIRPRITSPRDYDPTIAEPVAPVGQGGRPATGAGPAADDQTIEFARITSTAADDGPGISLARDLRGASDEQIVVGDVPRQPTGFQDEPPC